MKSLFLKNVNNGHKFEAGTSRNGSAGAILNEVDGQRSVADIVASLEQQFPDAGPLGKDVSEFLQDARQHHWIELS